jgi:hypothetical protein
MSACHRGRLTFLVPSPGGSSHLRRTPRRRRGHGDGRYGTRPALRRRVALQRGAGRARGAGGPTGAGNSLLAQSHKLIQPFPRSLTRRRSAPRRDWASWLVNQAPSWASGELRLRGDKRGWGVLGLAVTFWVFFFVLFFFFFAFLAAPAGCFEPSSSETPQPGITAALKCPGFLFVFAS